MVNIRKRGKVYQYQFEIAKVINNENEINDIFDNIKALVISSRNTSRYWSNANVCQLL